MTAINGHIQSPWIAFGVVVAACTGFLCWHAYARDPQDAEWTDSDVPPPMASISSVPGVTSPDTSPAGIGDPMRYRRYPMSLVSASASVIGTF